MWSALPKSPVGLMAPTTKDEGPGLDASPTRTQLKRIKYARKTFHHTNALLRTWLQKRRKAKGGDQL